MHATAPSEPAENPGPDAPKRVVIADPHASICEMIKTTLHVHENCKVVGEAHTSTAALDECLTKDPDILIVDPGFPDLGGGRFVRQCRGDHHRVNIFVFCGHTTRHNVADILDAGPDAFVHKEEKIAVFYRGLRAVIEGARFYSPYANSMQRIDNGKNGSRQKLGRRDREVLTLLAKGRSSKEIASVLKIATKTVDHYRSELMKKLDIHDIAGLTRYAVGAGLIRLDG